MGRLWHKAGRAAITLLALAFGAGSAGCGTILLRDVPLRGDGWSVLLEGLRLGPNSIAISGGMYSQKAYVAPAGHYFIWAFMKIHNDLPQDHVFSYDACDVDLDDKLILPAVISRYMGPTADIERNENYPPGDLSHRILIYAYPDGRLPTRLRCPGFTVPIPSRPR